MATIKDLAKYTGLGIATVSKYLNGGNLRAENKILLDEAVAKLGYTMNNTARALKTNRTHMVGIVIPELSNVFITGILTEVEDILRRNGYGVLVTDCRSDAGLEQQSVEFLLSKQVDGIINMPIGTDGSHLISALKKKIPVVLVDRFISMEGTDFVGVDNILAGALATDLLLSKGHRRIAIITGPRNLSTATERLQGYYNSHEINSIVPIDYNIVHAEFTIESGYRAMKDLLNNRADFTAIFATNYEITIGAIIALNEHGVNLPHELSIVGFDNIELSRVINPKLTVVAQPIMQIATKTAEVMLARLAGSPAGERVVLKPYIEHGKTVSVNI